MTTAAQLAREAAAALNLPADLPAGVARRLGWIEMASCSASWANTPAQLGEATSRIEVHALALFGGPLEAQARHVYEEARRVGQPSGGLDFLHAAIIRLYEAARQAGV